MLFKKIAVPFLLALCATTALAQSVEQGVRHLYYERKIQALEALQPLVAKEPRNVQAVYWLGQAHLASPADVQAAKNLYQQAISGGLNDPLLQVALAHARLLEGASPAELKPLFEQAIQTTRKKNQDNPEILLAIGRAHADGGKNVGDPLYGIETLKRAAALDKKNPEIPYLIGISYLKLGGENGGAAVEAFREAVLRDPQYARALYRIGKIYESQENKEAMERYYGEAIAADAAFAPAYLAFFYWYANRDVNVAKEFIDKYIAHSPKSCETDFWSADFLFRAGKYRESLAQAQAMEANGCAGYYQLPVLFAYNYERLGDSVQARSHLQKFFAQAKPEQVLPDHYLFAAGVYKRFAGSEPAAIELLTRAIAVDTVRRNQVKYMDTVAALYRKLGDAQNRFVWVQKSYQHNLNPSNRDLFDYAEAAAAARQYPLADSLFRQYRNQYPDQAVGYYYRAKYAMEADSTLASAIEPINDYLGFMARDTDKYKPSIIYYHSVLAQYYANTLKDYAQAVQQFEKILAVDPANADAKKYADQLRKILERKAAQSQKATPAGSR